MSILIILYIIFSYSQVYSALMRDKDKESPRFWEYQNQEWNEESVIFLLFAPLTLLMYLGILAGAGLEKVPKKIANKLNGKDWNSDD